MGTRSITRVIADGEPIVAMYRQMDGYPAGHGKELAEFLDGVVMVNGIGMDSAGKKIANGYDCLAAQLVAHFKTEPGGIYLVPTKKADHGQEYEYDVIGEFGNPPKPPMVRVRNGRKVIFTGNVDAFKTFCEKEDS